MATKFSFSPEDLRRGFSMAKLVRPVSGDYILRIVDGSLWISSTDRRRQVHAVVSSRSPSPGSGSSDDFYLSIDRSALFESDLTDVTLSLTDKGLVIKAEGDGQVRQATVKRRVDSARRSPMPSKPSVSGASVPAKKFEELLHQLSCSALVKDTKTDEDRRVNQVHFYPNEGCGSSNARIYATVAYMDGLSLELSVVSDDIPVMRTFCSKSFGNDIIVGQDRTKMFLSDPKSGSVISFSRVSCNKPVLQVLSDDGYGIQLEISKLKFNKALQWVNMAREGTRRASFKASGDLMNIFCNGQEVSSLPVKFITGSSLSVDLPADTLSSIISYVSSENVMLKFQHKVSPTILEVCDSLSPDSVSSGIVARHFLQSMKEKGS